MKKSIMLFAVISAIFILSPAFAQDMQSQGMDMQGMHGMQMQHDNTESVIREANINGYQFTYHLIDMQARMKNMQGMKGMEMNQNMVQKAGSHHLMVYIKDANGNTIDNAKTGYLIIGPDGKEQKVMTMAMSGGYGADIDLSKPGAYTIKCKAVAGGQKLLDEFSYKIAK